MLNKRVIGCSVDLNHSLKRFIKFIYFLLNFPSPALFDHQLYGFKKTFDLVRRLESVTVEHKRTGKIKT